MGYTNQDGRGHALDTVNELRMRQRNGPSNSRYGNGGNGYRPLYGKQREAAVQKLFDEGNLGGVCKNAKGRG
jgi:hypothetical protein